MDQQLNIAAAEAQRDFQSIVDRVAEGQEVTVTRNGIPVARIVPIQAPSTGQSREQAVQALRTFSRGRTLNGLTIQDLISEGRR